MNSKTTAKGTIYAIPGPVVFVDLFEPDLVWYPNYGRCALLDAVNNEEGRCAVCGKKISWRVVVLGADKKYYIVGQDCAKDALKVSDGTISNRQKLAKNRAKKEKARATARASLEELKKNEKLQSIPHPLTHKRSQFKDKTMIDYLNYWLDQGKDGTVTADDYKRAMRIVSASLMKLDLETLK